MCVYTFTVNSESAKAEPDSTSVGKDIQELSKELETKPDLEGFRGLGTEFDRQAEKAIASVENLEKMFLGESYLENKPWTGLKEVAGTESKVAELEELVKKGEEAVVDGGATDAEIGAESLDAAEFAAMVTGTAGLIGGELPLAGVVGYEDIVTGHNEIGSKLFSGVEDYNSWQKSAESAPHDEPAEKIHWIEYLETEAQRILEWNSTVSKEFKPTSFWPYSYLEWKAKCPSGPKYLEKGAHEICFPSEAVLPNGKKLSQYSQNAYGGSCPGAGGYAGDGDQFVLTAEVSGTWYLSACEGQSQSSLTVHNGPATCGGVCLKNWGSLNSECWSIIGGPGGGNGIAGWPIQIGPYVTYGKTQEYCQKPFGAFEGYENETSIDRHRSRFHVGLPRPLTKSQAEKLESEGHEVNHGEGHVCTNVTCENTVIKKLAERSKEGGQRRREKAECNWMKCELEERPLTPESEVEPEEPSKPSGVSPSVPGTIEVPSCFLIELTGTGCKSLLMEVGFTDVEIDVRTWEHAVVTKPAEAVVSVSPSAGSIVETSTKLIVESNPDAASMPALVPSIKHGTETGTQYKERLETEGWTKVEVKTLTESATDPTVGPEQASYTVPKEGTSEDPAKTAKIEVEQNPTTAPSPSEGGGIGPPTLPGFKIPNFGVLCKGFPFGVPCWLIKTVQSWSASSSCPVWSIGEYTIHGKKIPEASINLCSYGLEPIMEKARVAMLIFSTLGLVLLFYRFAKGGSPPSGGGSDIGYTGNQTLDDGAF